MANRMHGNKKKFSNRLVAWIDILGWKEIVKKQRIHEVLKLVEKAHERVTKDTLFQSALQYTPSGGEKMDPVKIEEFKRAVYKQDRQISLFSDSIIISYSSDHEYLKWSWTELLETITYLQDELVSRGYLLRGAVTFGELYHKESICFGSALIRVIGLESVYANQPRIIFDKKFTERKLFLGWINESFNMVKLYEDGYYGTSHFLKFKSLISAMQFPEESEPRLNITFLFKKYYDLISSGLMTKSASVFLKHQWLADQYIEEYEKYSLQGKIEGFRQMNLELHYKTTIRMRLAIVRYRYVQRKKTRFLKSEYGV